MKFVILLVATFCCMIYSTSGETTNEMACFDDEFNKPCQQLCSGIQEATRHCCPISRCVKCWTDIGINKCGPKIKKEIVATMTGFADVLAAEGCTESEEYPSTKCNYYFYKPWFYVVPLLIMAVIGGVVAFVVRRRRRRWF